MVKYIQEDWNKTKDGIGDLIGKGRMWNDGMIDELKKINDNLENAKAAIAKYDSDGVISFYHTDKSRDRQRLFESFHVLHSFTDKVGNIVDRTIDDPFYKDIDAFVETMRDATISSYTTENRIGATRQQQAGYYGQGTTIEVTKDKVSLEDLFNGDNYYAKEMLQAYEEAKVEFPEEDFSFEDFQWAAVNSHAFQYESLKDQQYAKEFWAGIIAMVVIIGTAIVCPPAGLALGAAYGTLELGTAVTGKDWVSGRELDTGERWLRGALAPLDIVPAAKGIKSFSNAVRLGNHAFDLGQFGMKNGLRAGLRQEMKHMKDMVVVAGMQSKTRLRNARVFIKDTTRLAKEKLINDTIDAARAGDKAITAAKNIIPSRKTMAVDDLGNLFHVPAENKHTLEKLTTNKFKPDGVGVGSKADNAIKGMGNKTDKITDGVIRDGSHMSTDGALKPNVKYKAGEYEYLYETDNMGRLKEFNADDLKLTERDCRLPHKSNTPGKETGDHAGHLAGDRFGGSPDLDNLVSQSSNVNLSKYKKLENQWATAIKEGKKVSVNVKVNYDGTGLRPTSFEIKNNIDGVIKKVRLKN
ncbi:Predicted ribonuclease, toxin component of the YeeF-YezG toxin-antitoxin module [Evansella caseinilytica]|uniref:Predicted ribonuclease, toxin component of the YeeF-YezG toxin-antitoxin module n=1 Tax=Evansella caseinilytica TaxID=1503961 RepID=A0A1H3TL42_9BACI|nr:DNA/RNA non-specific endonuclease [Evansella caseinilytica]SDZ50531.1 Predicted ribonuclease, toxin component of the YeeF-YezG toxin-antitoxin module [Evansella caseinilytica]